MFQWSLSNLTDSDMVILNQPFPFSSANGDTVSSETVERNNKAEKKPGRWAGQWDIPD